MKLPNKGKKPHSPTKKYLKTNKQINEKDMSLEVDLNRVTETLQYFVEQIKE